VQQFKIDQRYKAIHEAYTHSITSLSSGAVVRTAIMIATLLI